MVTFSSISFYKKMLFIDVKRAHDWFSLDSKKCHNYQLNLTLMFIGQWKFEGNVSKELYRNIWNCYFIHIYFRILHKCTSVHKYDSTHIAITYSKIELERKTVLQNFVPVS